MTIDLQCLKCQLYDEENEDCLVYGLVHTEARALHKTECSDFMPTQKSPQDKLTQLIRGLRELAQGPGWSPLEGTMTMVPWHRVALLIKEAEEE